eukprot:TRINITY_DN8612_c0_g2_i2.p1 TRINITY_DN8612_c0_g2~~TRINITY_DN8612_c0_g2_i2.p1  ORF type:complete len:899 (+),score=75.67 TRINITY_DN8612_c0_g2_i2:239-2935(+)
MEESMLGVQTATGVATPSSVCLGPRLLSKPLAGRIVQHTVDDRELVQAASSQATCIPELFQRIVAEQPDALAVTSEPLEDPAEEAEEEEARALSLQPPADAASQACDVGDVCGRAPSPSNRDARFQRKMRFRRERYMLSYKELDSRVRALSAKLRERICMISLRAGADSAAACPFVAICLDRTVALTVAVLGTLSAGAGYVPLEPSHPGPRLRFLLDDSSAGLLLTCWCARRRGLLPEDRCIRIAPVTGQLLLTEADKIPLQPWPDEKREHVLSQWDSSIAYLLYTSGSTGAPKGVIVPRRGVQNQLFAFDDMVRKSSNIRNAPTDVLVALATICFDIAALELLWPICFGFQSFIASSSTRRNSQRLARLLEEVQPRIVQATPVTWRGLVQAGWKGHGRLAGLSGGEAFPPSMVEALLARCGAGMWNIYGPTETTLWCTTHALHRDGNFICGQSQADVLRVPVGRPIDNMVVALAGVDDDADAHALQEGDDVEGELFIGGIGVSLGYHRNPELTDAKFVSWPGHCCDTVRSGMRGYKSGDLMRFIRYPDVVSTGNDESAKCANSTLKVGLEFLGRLDFQIKFRGFRIELGEIEALLERHPLVHMATCVLHSLHGVSGDTESCDAGGKASDGIQQGNDKLALVAFVELAKAPVPHDDINDETLAPKHTSSDDAQPTARYVSGVVSELVAGQTSSSFSYSVAESQSGLRAYLARQLPSYMVPMRVVVLENIPLSPNGKADRTALKEMPLEKGNRAAKAHALLPPGCGQKESPETNPEMTSAAELDCSLKSVAGLVSSISGVDFDLVQCSSETELAALGVDSSTAVRLAEAISDRFFRGREPMQAEELFVHTTLLSLCHHIESRRWKRCSSRNPRRLRRSPTAPTPMLTSLPWISWVAWTD